MTYCSRCACHSGKARWPTGSKRGIFLTVLRQWVEEELPAASDQDDELVCTPALDLLLVAALELGRQDEDVRDLVDRARALLAAQLAGADPLAPETLLGRRLLHRAGIPACRP